MVVNGILPIDQLREHWAPSSLVAQRVPKIILEAVYGIQINPLHATDGNFEDNRSPTAEELLVAYAKSRGFTKSGQGNPDEARASRHILKDYVNVRRLLYNLLLGKAYFCPTSSRIRLNWFSI